jgi:hypothetical protein
MGKTGFSKLLDSLTVTSAPGKRKEEDKQPAPDGDPAKPVGETKPAAVDAHSTAAVQKTIPMDSESLRLEDWERECMKKLNELVPSPRAAKRFVNVYRLLRASVADDQWSNFIGDADGGLHRPVLLLLAILTGYPAEATEILRALLEGRPTTTFWALIDELENTPAPTEDPERWSELFVRLRGLRGLVPEHQQCAELIEYALQVARYSFQSGRILLTQVKATSLTAGTR